jgi:hypothetical protein
VVAFIAQLINSSLLTSQKGLKKQLRQTVRKKWRQTNFKYPITSPVKFGIRATDKDDGNEWTQRKSHGVIRVRRIRHSYPQTKVFVLRILDLRKMQDSSQITFEERTQEKGGRGNETEKLCK